jgi:hypothetical protein
MSERERAVIAKLIAEWGKFAERYEKCGSDWHMKMPGDWPMGVALTVDDVRSLAAPPAIDAAIGRGEAEAKSLAGERTE